jgi:hypothetical protein
VKNLYITKFYHITLFSLVLMAFLLVGQKTHAELATESRAGEITLKEAADIFDTENAFSFELGNKLQFKCSYFITEIFGRKVLWAGADIFNNSEQSLHFAYYAAFFDKDGNLVGSVADSSLTKGLSPQRRLELTNVAVPIPASEFSKIRTYRVTVYESDTEIGR